MTRLGDAIRLYGRYAAASVKGQLQYRASAVMTAFGVFLITSSEFVAVWALFDRFGQVRGWRLPEIALFYGLISVTWALCDAISRGFDNFAQTVKSGDFDRILLRPRSTVLQLLGQEFTLRRVGRLVQGSSVLGYAFAAGTIDWTVGRAVLLIAAIAGGVCVFLGILILQATSAFWTVESLEVWSSFTYGGLTMGQYPLAIYRSWFRALFTYLFPIGCVSYFPGVVILGRADPLGAPIWRIGVRHYRSTGS
jgi:ABC-2 type transport system permease protein